LEKKKTIGDVEKGDVKMGPLAGFNFKGQVSLKSFIVLRMRIMPDSETSLSEVP